MSLRKPQFVTHNSESSFIYEKGIRRSAPSSGVASEKQYGSTPRFVDKNPLLPTKASEVAVFNSSGEKIDYYGYLKLLTNNSESLYTSPSEYLNSREHQLGKKEEARVLKETTKYGQSSERQKTADIYSESKPKCQLNKNPTKRNRTKTQMTRRRRSITNPRYSDKVQLDKNDPLTDSIPSCNVKTQTDQKLWTNCSQCIEQDTFSQTSLNGMGASDTTNLKKSPNIKNDASLTEIWNRTSTRLSTRSSDASFGSPISGNFADLAKNTVVLSNKQLSKDHTHQEIIKLKKDAARRSSASRNVTVLAKTLPVTSSSGLYRGFEEVTKNGPMRNVLSILLLILFFWLLTILHVDDFIIGTFRMIGRYISSWSVLLTGRKKKPGNFEIASKYVMGILRFIRTVVAGTPNPGRQQ